MQRVQYIGPYDEVLVPDAQQTVMHGQTIEVSDELAAGLLCQESNWKKVTTKSAPAAEKE